MNRTLLRQCVISLSFCVAAVAQAQVSDDPWFEIELIAFERGTLSNTLEKFDNRVTPIPVQRSVDLLQPLYQPDIQAVYAGLPQCRPNPPTALPAEFAIVEPAIQPWFDEIQLAEQSVRRFSSEFPAQPLLNWPLACQSAAPVAEGIVAPQLVSNRDATAVAGPQVLPVIPQISQIAHQQNQPYLIDESAFQLKDLAWQLNRRAGHTLLLHTTWRQALGPKRRTQSLRFFAGQRFSPQFDYQGLRQNSVATPHADQADLTAAIEKTYQQLQQQQQLSRDAVEKTVPGLPQQVWQLDGVIQPYNERMLFADTEFNLRQLRPGSASVQAAAQSTTLSNAQSTTEAADSSTLQTFYVKDSVRLLLGEIHYLDHPRFGLILQIRRFTPPAAPIVDEGVTP
jgi:hypothetical protein